MFGATVLASQTLIPAFAAERTVLVPAATTDAKSDRRRVQSRCSRAVASGVWKPFSAI